eukprot:scaffold140471_cov57-Phaeocystis_antarctica.AAC.1
MAKWSLTTAERSAPASSTLIGGGMTLLKRPYGVACGRGGRARGAGHGRAAAARVGKRREVPCGS